MGKQGSGSNWEPNTNPPSNTPTPVWKGCKRIGTTSGESNSSAEPDALVFHPLEIAKPVEVKAGHCWRRTSPAPTSITNILKIYPMETRDFQDSSCRERGKQVTNSELWWWEAADMGSERCQCLHEPAGPDNVTLHGRDGKRRHGWNLSSGNFCCCLELPRLCCEENFSTAISWATIS